ncbi:uncharacterized protein PV09_01715 [Verruconis gallopava]|uniref:Uncharacterized protein n=1 Tax=Verruconis gallopava TaxID=253628 RepID=A0A0D2AMQ9_9PEZI|nr:uncharacterized protein PV09_01715 [Verruconis gallopava]KIW07790.1 hypothetical protein PV09_01715 [Verruconis gallopava]
MADSTSPRKFKVEPIESSIRRSRKCAPEPAELTPDSPGNPIEDAKEKLPKRKFLPQLIETTRTSSGKNLKTQAEPQDTLRKFTPQLMETSTDHRRSSNVQPQEDQPGTPENSTVEEDSVIQELPARRRFTPLLIDTAKRTRRTGDVRPAHFPSDRTDAIPEPSIGIRRSRTVQLPAQPENTPVSTSLPSPALTSAECRRLGIPVPRRGRSTSSQRQHSFRAPSLEPIESSESGDESKLSSSSSTPSSSSDLSYQMYKHATRLRESVDASSQGYLLELAAKAAERQLREQALAAFPNDDRHVRVDHYIGHDYDSPMRSIRSDSDRYRFGSVNWELKDMRRHAEFLEANKERERAAREARKRWNREYERKCGAWRNPFKNAVPHTHKDSVEMERMRKKARPPMLGADIEFPRCSSPEPARFDVTQGTYNERAAMCYLTEQSSPGPCGEGLWAVTAKKSIGAASVHSQAASRAPSTGSCSGGLWGGMCQGKAGNLSPPRGPTGLLTPREDATNLLEPSDATRNLHQLPPSPPPSNSGVASLDEKLELELAIEAEFNDEFVTQVYNYLSLGYPSIARRYDEELGKIARVAVTDLRHDDELESSRGYIRFGKDGNGAEEGIREDMCARWKALKAYIHEWARQQPGMCEPNNKHGGFGVAVRRGSWAW